MLMKEGWFLKFKGHLFVSRRKKEAREVRVIAKKARKLRGIKAKIFNKKRFKEKIIMKKL